MTSDSSTVPALPALTPAQLAANEAQARIHGCIDSGRSFLVEAGAGAGKTHSLVAALQHCIATRGNHLKSHRQLIACITYTNVATAEILARTDRHPVVFACTIHSFCWAALSSFQSDLRREIATLPEWAERIAEYESISAHYVEYSLGRRSIDDHRISLHHNDVLVLMIRLLGKPKFRRLLVSRFPILFVDEYQDTDAGFAEALRTHFISAGDQQPLLLGLFGDHWQKIYGNGCGAFHDEALQFIPKGANFRSCTTIVECLNRMRPQLPQDIHHTGVVGTVSVMHTNGWPARRRTGQHWQGDLQPNDAQRALEQARAALGSQGWDWSPTITKILMLTHRGLASVQGYSDLAGAFSSNEQFIKKEDPHIAFFCDRVEPIVQAYQARRYGDMFDLIGSGPQPLRSHGDKLAWAHDMDDLVQRRETGSIGDVLQHIRAMRRFVVPEAIERLDQLLNRPPPTAPEDEAQIKMIHGLWQIPYVQVIALRKFIEEQTPFATKHGVKGAEFENVLVVLGRGWNLYNFNEFLEMGANSEGVTSANLEQFERNRNLFYVACSRPKRRLALLFTQQLSGQAIATLTSWFGQANIHALSHQR